jgi:hypothetical protein
MPYLQQQMKTNNALLVSHVVGVPVYYSYLFQVKVIPKIDAFSASYIAVHFPCQARLLLTEARWQQRCYRLLTRHGSSYL